LEPDLQAVAVEREVVLKGVHHLVPQHVARFAVGGSQRHHHALAEALREAARARPEGLLRHVRLLKVGVVGVEDDRLLVVEAVEEDLRVTLVPALGHPGRVAHRRLLHGVVVEFEVLGLQHLEVKGLVLHPVFAEVLPGGVGHSPHAGEDGEEKDGDREPVLHGRGQPFEKAVEYDPFGNL
jgi:hypothetical protein